MADGDELYLHLNLGGAEGVRSSDWASLFLFGFSGVVSEESSESKRKEVYSNLLCIWSKRKDSKDINAV